MSDTFGQALRRHRIAAGLSQRQLAHRAHLGQSDVSRYERDQQNPTPSTADTLDGLTDADGHLRALATIDTPSAKGAPTGTGAMFGDETAAMELARRVAASDVGPETVDRLTDSFDELATAYPKTSPERLVMPLRTRLQYVDQLLNSSRLSLAAHRQLVVLGGWYSLLAATVHIDLGAHDVATAQLRTARVMSEHAGHHELQSWCFETEAWRLLSHGRYQRAVELAQHACSLAPPGTSAEIQAAGQVGRASARLGDADATYRAVARIHGLATELQQRHSVEHHYQYDRGKVWSYTATILSWAGDPDGMDMARRVADLFTPAAPGQLWPRRGTEAHVDLALGATRIGDYDQAASALRTALHSGVLPPSTRWRVREVLTELSAARASAVPELEAAYRAQIIGNS